MGGLCSGGGPPWHVMGVDCIQSEYNCNTLSSVRQVERSAVCPSAPRIEKVSWTEAQINVASDPAGLVSGSTGQWGQACLCPTGAACGSVS